MIVHLKRTWGDDESLCGRVGKNAEAVLAPELVTCKRCRFLMLVPMKAMTK